MNDDRYDEAARHSSVLDRLQQATEQAGSQDHADQFGYNAQTEDQYPSIYTPAQPEGELDHLGPAGMGNEQLISNGGSYGHNGDE
jgi:hypothetical protein